MNYKNYEIRITPAKIPRHDNNGQVSEYDGFIVEIFDQESETPVEVFNAAVGCELLNNDIEEAEQIAKDYIDLEEKENGVNR